ncbi:MAG: efflux RND transporter periplasmic adaptor subunit [Alcanivoracaceae bacterium]|nr:efflux RND transporter periplasmic adaptor subunit [Alcanivoracaceae bacterium]
MQNKKIIQPLLLLIISFFVVWLIFNNKPVARKFRQLPVQKLRTEVMDPQPQSYTVWIPSYGIVQPKTQSLMIAQVSGQVTKVADKFRDGAFFEKDDTLLIIDDADYQAQLTIAKADLRQAEFTHADEKARSAQASKDWYDLGNIKKPPSLVARQPQLNSSQSNLEASQAKVLQAQLNLQRTNISAPFAGRVLNLEVNVGQVVNNGTILGSIYAVDSAEIRLPLKQNQLSHLHLPEIYRDIDELAEQNVIKTIVKANIGNKIHFWEGEIVRVEGTIDTQTRQLYVVAEVKDPYKFRVDGTPPLKIGQFVNVLIKGNDLKDVVVLPRSAVYSGNYINVVEAGVLERIVINPVWKDDDYIVIKNKFKTGQKISITPLGDVISGTQVDVIDINNTDILGNNKRTHNE